MESVLKRRTFTKEFKEETCNLVLIQGNKISHVARDLGIGENLLGRWIREFKNQSNFSGSEEEEKAKKIRFLESENRRLRTEREILKKAMAYFVEKPQ